MIVLFIILAFILWLASGIYLIEVYGEKYINVNLWSLLSVVFPVVNTIIATIIFISRSKWVTFGEFVKKLKSKFKKNE